MKGVYKTLSGGLLISVFVYWIMFYMLTGSCLQCLGTTSLYALADACVSEFYEPAKVWYSPGTNVHLFYFVASNS